MTQIRRRCACGCGGITNYGRSYIFNHHGKGIKLSKNHRRKLSLAHKGQKPMLGHKHSEETKLKMSLARKGRLHTKEHALKISLSKFKCNPNYKYCDEWKDGEFKKDCMKDYCENADCRERSKNLIPHHIDLNPKDCRPCNIGTMCISCHSSLHKNLYYLNNKKEVNHKDYLTIVRTNRITYIHKATRTKITLRRKVCA